MEGRGEDEVTAGRGDLLSEVNEVEGRGELGEAAAGGFRGGGGVLERPPIVWYCMVLHCWLRRAGCIYMGGGVYSDSTHFIMESQCNIVKRYCRI